MNTDNIGHPADQPSFTMLTANDSRGGEAGARRERDWIVVQARRSFENAQHRGTRTLAIHLTEDEARKVYVDLKEMFHKYEPGPSTASPVIDDTLPLRASFGAVPSFVHVDALGRRSHLSLAGKITNDVMCAMDAGAGRDAVVRLTAIVARLAGAQTWNVQHIVGAELGYEAVK